MRPKKNSLSIKDEICLRSAIWLRELNLTAFEVGALQSSTPGLCSAEFYTTDGPPPTAGVCHPCRHGVCRDKTGRKPRVKRRPAGAEMSTISVVSATDSLMIICKLHSESEMSQQSGPADQHMAQAD